MTKQGITPISPLESVKNLANGSEFLRNSSRTKKSNSELAKQKKELVKILNFIRNFKDQSRQQELHDAIVSSEQYQNVQQMRLLQKKQEKTFKLQEKEHEALLKKEEIRLNQYEKKQTTFIEQLEQVR